MKKKVWKKEESKRVGVNGSIGFAYIKDNEKEMMDKEGSKKTGEERSMWLADEVRQGIMANRDEKHEEELEESRMAGRAKQNEEVRVVD